MDETLLNELKEVKEMLHAVMSSQEQNENRIIRMLSTIEGRLYSIEESMNWIKMAVIILVMQKDLRVYQDYKTILNFY